MTKLTPTLEELEEMRASAPDGPVVIVNLLKFKPGQAARDAYTRYLQAASKAADPNVEILYTGAALGNVGTGESWDFTIIARYRRFDDFVRVVVSSAYQQDAASHRDSALERTVMLVTTPRDLFGYVKEIPVRIAGDTALLLW
jgi:hypothetical protein